MAAWGVTAGCLVLAVSAAACSGSDGEATATTLAEPVTRLSSTTVPPRPTSTTSTIYDPASVEGQVEAAYLRSWDVYADAVYNLRLDEAALARVYADPLLGVRRDEISSRIAGRRASLVAVEHGYRIEMTSGVTAAVIDSYRNHQVLIDSVTRVPVESDPDATIVDAFTLRFIDGKWIVFDQRRLS